MTLSAATPSINIQEELTGLVRGFFAAPVLSALSRLGAFEIMVAKGQFGTKDFPAVTNKALLHDSFQYLARIDLLALNAGEKEPAWSLTELGKQVFQRAGSFYVPHSYHQYMEDFYDGLTGQAKRRASVDRAENVIGSGRTHLRYFPFAISFLKRRVEFDVVLDVGCGDGKFLSAVLTTLPGKSALGVDCSEVSVKMTRENLRKEHPASEINIICADALKVQDWGPEVQKAAGNKRLAVSMWFLIHEISKNDPSLIVRFLNDFHRLFPEAPLVICEIVRHENEVLASRRKESIMPEYLFFHDISGQGVLSWQEYNTILQNIPYEIQSERLFDEIRDSRGQPVPSSFVWCLVPKKRT